VASVIFVGAYAYAREVLEAFPEAPRVIFTEGPGEPRWQDVSDVWPDVPVHRRPPKLLDLVRSDLVIVAGWRRLVPIGTPTVGFHSAKLPEYPGRAPVANAILRGDPSITNTMLWLDDGVDTGDIIDEWEFPLAGRNPDDVYREIGYTSAEMLQQHWDGLLDGTAPRRKQDVSKRGPLTPADAWERLP